MHPLLKRQLKRVGLLDPSVSPSPEIWEDLLKRISHAYTEADQGRELLEQSLAISSKEMQQLYDNLRQSSETRIKNAQDRTRMIIDHALDGVITVDEAGVIVDWNPQAEILFGWTKEEIVGQPLIEKIIPPEFREGHHRGFQCYLQTRQATMLNKRIEVSVLNRKGEQFSAELSVNPFTVEGRTIFSAFIRDITEQKEAEQSLRLAKETAEQAAKAKSEFLATMSHEIRTPMNGIIGMTGLLLDTHLTPEQHQFAETVRSSGEALLTIINDILDFSKIEAGKLDFEIIDFDLRVAMEDTLDLLAEKAGNAGLELVGCVDDLVPTHLKGDPGRFRQVLLNLVGNAIKFTKEGYVSVRVSLLDETVDTATIRVAVTDTGIGVDSTAQPLLFQPFQQADNSMTRQFGGTGLGLAICKKLVEQMGGTIGIDSQLGQGSTFWFTAHYLKQSKPPTTRPTKDLNGLRLCCIDNHPVNRQLLVEYSKAWGLRTTCASTPAEGLAMIQRAKDQGEPFHIAIVDMEMPGMDGMELARVIKAEPQIADIQLILLSSFGQRGDAKEAKAAGFSGYLTKPIRQNVLKQVLETVSALESGNLDQADTPVITRFSSLESKKMRSHRILVVDDHQVNQQLAIMMIERLGHRCDIAANGQEALDAIQKIPYDLIFMDCQMPEMDGFEATRKIREWEREGGRGERCARRSERQGNGQRVPSQFTDHVERETNNKRHRTTHLPIIAMTANAMRGDREACLAAGMDDYLWKPVKPEHLAHKLDKWLPKETNHEEQEMPKMEPTNQSSESNRTSPVDSEVLREWQSLGGPAFVTRMVDQFIKDATACIQEVERAVESRDPAQLSNAAHGLKGICRNMGANDLGALCESLERPKAPLSPESIEQQFVQLQQEFQLVCTTLEKEKENL